MHLSAEMARTLPLPPVIGALALISGIVLLFRENKKYENRKNAKTGDGCDEEQTKGIRRKA
jgi:hypothetical protein